MLALFCKGLVIGVVIALPLGPVGLLCLQRSLYGGVRLGLLSGAAAALGDALYGAVAALGLSFVSDYLTDHRYLLQLAGGVLLLAMGWITMRRPYAPKRKERSYHHLAGAFVSIFLLTLTNPMTIFAFLAIFAGFGLGHTHTTVFHAAAVVLGVFCGSMLWWVAIAFGGAWLNERISRHMRTIKTLSGLVILVFGLWALAEAGFHELFL